MQAFEVAALKPRHVWFAGLVALVVIILSMLIDAPHARDMLIKGDSDDIMRWMSVKDFLAGQSWFDMTQYRVEPPDGLSLHWSRYLDAAIAAVYSVLALMLTPEAAERWTLIIWPNLLLVALLVLVAKGTYRILGSAAAIFAIITVMTWFPIRGITFSNGRVDHHDLQILLMTCVTMAMIWPTTGLRAGIAAGMAAALSLAIGLEMLVFVAVAGVILFLRAVFDAEAAVARLAGFCLALLVGSLLFFVGQTAPSQWFVPHCDALSTPYLAILLIATTSCGAPLALYGRLRHPAARIGITAAMTLVGIWIFAPLMSPCLAGPYGMLPAEVQDFITSRISEALPGLVFAMIRPLTFIDVVVPILIVTALGTVFWVKHRKDWNATQRAAIEQMLVFGWLGFLGSMIQIRMNIIAAPALPFLAGLVFSQLLRQVLEQRRPREIARFALAVVAVFYIQETNRPMLFAANLISHQDLSKKIEAATSDKGCRSQATLAHLDSLPAARMLTMMSIGADLLLTTHHSPLSVPYQRGAFTFWNGSFPFRSEALMLKAIDQSKPDYVVLCTTSTYDGLHAYAGDLSKGNLPIWLQPVSVGTDELLVLRVDTAALPQH
ncbi:MAG: hypothetical protein ACOH2M_25975 [Cypionkella sp.]